MCESICTYVYVHKKTQTLLTLYHTEKARDIAATMLLMEKLLIAKQPYDKHPTYEMIIISKMIVS